MLIRFFFFLFGAFNTSPFNLPIVLALREKLFSFLCASSHHIHIVELWYVLCEPVKIQYSAINFPYLSHCLLFSWLCLVPMFEVFRFLFSSFQSLPKTQFVQFVNLIICAGFAFCYAWMVNDVTNRIHLLTSIWWLIYGHYVQSGMHEFPFFFGERVNIQHTEHKHLTL